MQRVRLLTRSRQPETEAQPRPRSRGADLTLFDRLGLELSNARSTTRDQIPTCRRQPTWVSQPVAERRHVDEQHLGGEREPAGGHAARSAVEYACYVGSDAHLHHAAQRAGIFLGQNDFFRITADPTVVDGVPTNRFGNIWGRAFYKTCGQLPASVQPQCGTGKPSGKRRWVGGLGGRRNSYKDGISKNLWNAKLPAANPRGTIRSIGAMPSSSVRLPAKLVSRPASSTFWAMSCQASERVTTLR